MPDLTATIPHQLSRAEAKRRIQEHISVLRSQQSALSGIQQTWSGDTLAFSLTGMGQAISGHLTVEDQAVHLTVTMPWLLQLFAQSIMPTIERQGRLLLEKEPEGRTRSPK